jgi:hypothetical protein
VIWLPQSKGWATRQRKVKAGPAPINRSLSSYGAIENTTPWFAVPPWAAVR